MIAINNIVVIDLGWGGLITATHIYEKIKKSDYAGVRIYFIILSIFKYGMSREEKIVAFDKCLLSIKEKFTPQTIILACNSLSAIYNDTVFSRTNTPVLNIIQINCDLAIKEYKNGDEIIVFASPLTVSENTYFKTLEKMGVAANKIHTIALPGLAKKIEEDINGNSIKEIIFNGIKQELIKSSKKKINIILGCTHYEYVQNAFKCCLETTGYTNLSWVVPRDYILNCINNGNTLKSKEIIIISYKREIKKKVRENLQRYFNNQHIHEAIENMLVINEL